MAYATLLEEEVVVVAEATDLLDEGPKFRTFRKAVQEYCQNMCILTHTCMEMLYEKYAAEGLKPGLMDILVDPFGK